MSATEKTRDRAHDPISLPAGSFEASDLEKIAAAAAGTTDDKRDDLVAAQLAKANARQDTINPPSQLPGHRLETVERVLVEGTEVPVAGGKKGETETVGEVKVTETIQVFDPKHAEEEAEATEVAPAAGIAASPPPADKG